MKKLLLLITVLGGSFFSQAQVVVAGVSPASVVGGYAFSTTTDDGWPGQTGTDWGMTLDFNVPGTFIQGEIVLVDDGTPGTNVDYGNNLNEEGCSPSAANAYTGKIVMIRRNSCNFSTKVLNAQNSGAIGVIVVNREDELNIVMSAGADGVNVTIPAVIIGKTDGDFLLNEAQSGPVEVFIGNKIGAFSNDVGFESNEWSAPLISKLGGVPSQLAQNDGEYSFELGSRVYNYGTAAQANVTLNATINGPGGEVYNETTAAFAINAATTTADSNDVWSGGAQSLPDFVYNPVSNSLHVPGRYTITYTLDLNGTADDYTADNTFTADFVIQDEIYSAVQLDATTGLPEGNAYYQPQTFSTFDACVVIDNPNASRLAVDGMYFSAVTSSASGLPLDGEEMALYFYSWDDVFTDFNDVNYPGNTWTLTELASGYYYYPSDLQGETVYGRFSNQVALQDNQRYLACVQTVNPEIYLGFDNSTNLTWNTDTYLQPIAPSGNDGTYYGIGFGSDIPAAVGVRVFNAAELGINEEASIEGSAYPNPAVDVVTVAMDAEGSATLNITDLAGRTVASHTISLVAGKAQINVADLNSGAYIFNVVLEDGRTSQFNVVKK